MGSVRGDSSWRSGTPASRRRTFIGSSRLTSGDVLLILLINALISLCISVVVFLVLARMTGYDGTPGPTQPVALVTPSPVIVSQRSTPTALSPGELPGTLESGDFYTVRSGDNLSVIAMRFGVSMEELMAANGLKNPDWIGVGQKLAIPKPGAPTPTSTVPPIPSVTETPLPFEPPTPPAGTTLPATRSTTLQTPTPTPITIEATAGAGPSVIIEKIEGSGDLAREMVVIANRGRLVNLEGWTLSDNKGNLFTFPNVMLWSDQAKLNLHTKKGNDTPADLYWNRTEVAWGSSGTAATLKNAQDEVVATYKPG